MRDTEEYEGFYLEPRSRKLDNGSWQPIVRVFRLIDGVVDEFYPLKDATDTFPSETDADNYAVDKGKAWADNN